VQLHRALEVNPACNGIRRNANISPLLTGFYVTRTVEEKGSWTLCLHVRCVCDWNWKLDIHATHSYVRHTLTD